MVGILSTVYSPQIVFIFDRLLLSNTVTTMVAVLSILFQFKKRFCFFFSMQEKLILV